MLHRAIVTGGLSILIAVVSLSYLAAGQHQGIIRKVDAAHRRMTIEVGGTSSLYQVAEGASLVRQDKGDKKNSAAIHVLERGLAELAVGSTIEFRTESLSSENVITAIKVTAAPPQAPKEKSSTPKKPPATKKAKQSKQVNKANKASKKKAKNPGEQRA